MRNLPSATYPQTCPQAYPHNSRQVGNRVLLAHLQSAKSVTALANKSGVRQITVMVATRVHASRLTEVLETQELLFREEQARTAAIADEIEQAKEALRKLGIDYGRSAERQETLSKAIMLYQDILKEIPIATIEQSSLATIIPEKTEVKTKPARVGKQHYRMLVALRSLQPLSFSELVTESQGNIRRVKSQMAEDITEKLVIANEEGYWLSQAGADLLQRFEDYRKLNNIALPPLDVSPDDDEQEEMETESDRQQEGES